MDSSPQFLGWIVYGAVVIFAVSGLLFVFQAARTGGAVTQMGLFQWAAAIACVVAFAVTDWNKLHLIWIVPAGYLVSFSTLGRSIGQLVGVTSAFLFGAAESRAQPITTSGPEPVESSRAVCDACGKRKKYIALANFPPDHALEIATDLQRVIARPARLIDLTRVWKVRFRDLRPKTAQQLGMLYCPACLSSDLGSVTPATIDSERAPSYFVDILCDFPRDFTMEILKRRGTW